MPYGCFLPRNTAEIIIADAKSTVLIANNSRNGVLGAISGRSRAVKTSESSRQNTAESRIVTSKCFLLSFTVVIIVCLATFEQ